MSQLKWEDVGKGYTFSVISSISSGDLMYGMIVYSNSAKRVISRALTTAKKFKKGTDGGDEYVHQNITQYT